MASARPHPFCPEQSGMLSALDEGHALFIRGLVILLFRYPCLVGNKAWPMRRSLLQRLGLFVAHCLLPAMMDIRLVFSARLKPS
jgi:hypothetical protein